MTKKTQKKLRKALLLISCAALLVCITVGVTVAYLTDSKAVTNTFTVGNVDIDLDENKPTWDAAKNEWVLSTTERVDTNQTFKVLPGTKVAKDPIVWVNNTSEDCYVYIKVINNLAGAEDDTKDNVAKQITDNGWLALGVDNVYYKDVDVSELPSTTAATKEGFKGIDTFNTVYIDGDIINTELAAFQNKTIEVTAYAVQKDGFNTAKAAWDATFGAPQGE